MKAPKCRLCGHEHWGNEAHKLVDVANGMANRAVLRKVVANTMANSKTDMANKGGDASESGADDRRSVTNGMKVGGSASDSKTRTYQYRDSEKRKAYMKEYMKAKRRKKNEAIN